MKTGRLILTIHQTAQRFYPGINNIRPDRFRNIVELLESWNLRLYGISEVDSAQDDAPAAAITFDDGYIDNIEPIEFLLQKGIRPAVFVPTAYIGRKNTWEYSSPLFPAVHLDGDRIRELARQGVEFGSHGVHHIPLSKLDAVSLRRELADSKLCLEDITGSRVDSISFPFGDYTSRVIDVARELGYRRGYVMRGDAKAPETWHEFIRPRVPIYGSDDYFSLRNKLLEQSRCERVKDRIINMLSSGSIIIRRRLK